MQFRTSFTVWNENRLCLEIMLLLPETYFQTLDFEKKIPWDVYCHTCCQWFSPVYHIKHLHIISLTQHIGISPSVRATMVKVQLMYFASVRMCITVIEDTTTMPATSTTVAVPITSTTTSGTATFTTTP